MDSPAAQRASFNQVLWQELQALRPDWCQRQDFTPAGFAAADDPAAEDGCSPALQDNLRELYQRIDQLDADAQDANEQPLSALCLSGGGIRSATFNLGVLQTLARQGLLGKFDYLSSVSGGGYIASWLQAWLHREQHPRPTPGEPPISAEAAEPSAQAATDKVIDQLGGRGQRAVDPLKPEPQALEHLRQFSNYLTPRLGLCSGDTWSAIAVVLRNLLLNWMVILPLLAALIVIPQGVYLIVQSTVPAGFGKVLLYIAVAIELLAALSVFYHRRLVRDPNAASPRYAWLCVLPVLAAAAVLSFAGLGYANGPVITLDAPLFSAEGRPLLVFCFIWSTLVPLAGWLTVEIIHWLRGRQADAEQAQQMQHTAKFEFVALAVSGVVATVLLALGTRALLLPFYNHPGLYVLLTLPMLIALYLLTRVLFVGLASLAETFRTGASPALMNDADREWWARLSGWLLAAAIGWLVLSGLCLFGQFLLDRITDTAKPLVAAAGGVSGIIAALLGSRQPASTTGNPSPWRSVALALAAPVFVVCAMLVITWATATLGGWIVTNANVSAAQIFTDPLTRQAGLRHTGFEWFWALPLLLLLAATVTGLIVNVNRFSMHGLYRNRLVRAYLGASNPQRRPDPFTGFDPADNLRMHKLRPVSGAQRLLPLVNVTLNVLRDARLAWQERKAESFSITPYYCGNYRSGYRPASSYGGQGGISLGTAITISGAAANPNMGYNSSRALALVMSLFNVRLGAWLGNPSPDGDATWRLPGPRQALTPMLGELFGFTTARFKYVNLSDGGHFDNLGLYEAVLRRCRYILVSDAGCDPQGQLGDLGNVLRKIRIDFGVPVHFEQQIRIPANGQNEPGLFCAIARIDYGAVDPGTRPGRLVYIKPTLGGRGDLPLPQDVYSYSRSVSEFPHESTADQWFSESQFESYRALGEHALGQVLAGPTLDTFEDLLARVENYMKARD